MNEFNMLNKLDAWFRFNCNGEWEHHSAITITTLDNPGWMIEVELKGTAFEKKSLNPKNEGIRDNNTTEDVFLSVRRVGTKFQAAGSSLLGVLWEFVHWAQSPDEL